MLQVREGMILENRRITSDLYLMRIAGRFEVQMGQFFMLKVPDSAMTLYRPISIFDYDETGVSFLYAVRGGGTELFSRQKQGDSMLLHGPYGNGFPMTEQKTALVGGGIGLAPLYLTAKRLTHAKLYIGLREHVYSEQELEALREILPDVAVQLVIGGLVTDAIDFSAYERVYACGPEPMMAAVARLHPNAYVSLERHMGCGIGACLSCSCKTGDTQKRVCKEGPVFLGSEVYA